MLLALGCSGTARRADDVISVDGGVISVDGGVIVDSALRIEPASATLTVSSRDVPATEMFSASLFSTGEKVNVRWRLESNLASVDSQGVVRTSGIAGGRAKLTAYYGTLEAQAELTINVELRDEPPAATVPDSQRAALDGVPEADPGEALMPANATRFLYPYEGTVMPRGLSAPVLQLSPGSLPPQDFKLRIRTEGFSWAGYGHVAEPSTPRITLPQDVWDAALASARGQRVELSVVKAVNGKAYGPTGLSIIGADGTLKGAVYYMTYQSSALGLWSVRPGDQSPPKHIVTGCVVCHSASSNGTRLSTGADQASVAARSGVYSVGADGEATPAHCRAGRLRW